MKSQHFVIASLLLAAAAIHGTSFRYDNRRKRQGRVWDGLTAARKSSPAGVFEDSLIQPLVKAQRAEPEYRYSEHRQRRHLRPQN